MKLDNEISVDEKDYAFLKDTYACPCDESKMYDKFLMPEKAKGMWVWFDGEEEPYLDLVLNYSSVNFGHCYPPIVEIAKKVIERVDQIHSFHSKDKLELSEYLAKKVSIDENYKVYFNIGGSKGSESYSGVWGGVGISYRITENQSLNSFAFVSDDNYGRVEKISLGYTYEFGK